MVNTFQFISDQKSVTTSNQESGKEQGRLFYFWSVERVVETKEVSFYMDYFPSSSIDAGIQTFKESIIAQINTSNLFDFDFHPKEKDYLSIVNANDKDEYLNLIYLENTWHEERFFNSLKQANTDVYELIAKGVLKL